MCQVTSSLDTPWINFLFSNYSWEMDPVSAYGVAASTVQFITFATSLIHQSIEIYGSGSTSETRSLEDTYQTLKNFSDSPGLSVDVDSVDPVLRNHMQFLKHLSNTCHDDCEKLLRVASKLKAASSGRRRILKTFKAAWATFIKDDEITSLGQRLARQP